ncbi:M4 family metallopeptidase [Streptomyces regalis]|uniref:M4 family metallopeptidase n=1 Tax=Streptomyces regalis TaxID=68262 RepID=UPI00131D355C|nr:M4 family metallopeptidase [Streptomyces regalis]
MELAPFIAEGALSAAEREEWLAREASRLVEAIQEVGAIAQVPSRQIKDWTRRLERSRPSAPASHPLAQTGLISLPVLERLTQDGLQERGLIGAGVILTEDGPQPLSGAVSAPDLVIFDAGHSEKTSELPVVRYTGMPPVGDPMVDETYEALMTTRRFFQEVYGRARFPYHGRPLAAVVHYGDKFPNSWWDGASLFLGDGDGGVFQRFSQCLEVVGAEATRGIEEMLHFIPYQGQTGALSASISEVFGSLIKQWSLGQSTDEADWIMGAGLLAPGRQGAGLRSLKAPGTAYDDNVLGKDPQTAHMDDYVVTDRDNGGIHTNSGIPSHAFYLLAARLGGQAWERAGQIWWDALTSDGMRDGLQFVDWARLTLTAARTRYGDDSQEEHAVREAWSGVGVAATTSAEVADDEAAAGSH